MWHSSEQREFSPRALIQWCQPEASQESALTQARHVCPNSPVSTSAQSKPQQTALKMRCGTVAASAAGPGRSHKDLSPTKKWQNAKSSSVVAQSATVIGKQRGTRMLAQYCNFVPLGTGNALSPLAPGTTKQPKNQTNTRDHQAAGTQAQEAAHAGGGSSFHTDLCNRPAV